MIHCDLFSDESRRTGGVSLRVFVESEFLCRRGSSSKLERSCCATIVTLLCWKPLFITRCTVTDNNACHSLPICFVGIDNCVNDQRLSSSNTFFMKWCNEQIHCDTKSIMHRLSPRSVWGPRRRQVCQWSYGANLCGTNTLGFQLNVTFASKENSYWCRHDFLSVDEHP